MINMENFDYVIINSDFSVTVGAGARFSKLVDVVATAGRELSRSLLDLQCLHQSYLTEQQPSEHALALEPWVPCLVVASADCKVFTV